MTANCAGSAKKGIESLGDFSWMSTVDIDHAPIAAKITSICRIVELRNCPDRLAEAMAAAATTMIDNETRLVNALFRSTFEFEYLLKEMWSPRRSTRATVVLMSRLRILSVKLWRSKHADRAIAHATITTGAIELAPQVRTQDDANTRTRNAAGMCYYARGESGC